VADLRAFAALHEEICAGYDQTEIGRRLAAVLHGLISGSPALTSAERDRLLAVLDRGEASAAKALYSQWDEAYLDLADEHDGDVEARAAVYRALSVSRLAAAVAEFTTKDCRDPDSFSSVMYELAAGLDWQDEALIDVVRKELT
jgi:hypothetical protein